MRESRAVVWFKEVGREDLGLVGGKGANLGEMTRASIPVPPGFIVTTDAYFRFLEEAGIKEQIQELLEALDPDDSDQLNDTANRIKGIIVNAPMPEDISKEIREAYQKLGGLVAVRSSATAEDLPEASFAGQQRTFLNIERGDAVVEAVQGCWASLFEPRAIFYRHQQNLDHMRVGIAVPVQKMVQSETAGIMFTAEPLTSDRGKITIEAVFGLGEAIVSGDVTPDLYLVDKESFGILEKEIAKQEWELVRNPSSANADDANVKVSIADELQRTQKLDDQQILDLAKMGVQIEEHYGFPQDIEWARQDGQLFVVQTRPVTTLKEPGQEQKTEEISAPVLLSGSPASPGIGSGPVKIVLDASRINEVKKGDILVADMTTPDFVPAMKRAAGIVTDRGGRTCHAAIVSRELGIPCVVGVGNGTRVLRPGQEITVDGSAGKVYEGAIAVSRKQARPSHVTPVKTRTKIYVNLAEPELAEVVATRDVDGVGLLRAEFMIAQIGEHPRYMLKMGRGQEFTDKLAEGLEKFAKAFHPRPVVYRTTDFKTNEYRNLKGGQEYEEPEENPMLGYRGCSRYVKEIEVFRLEVEAIKKVRQSYANLWVMIPFVRTVAEITRVRDLLASEGLTQSSDFKLWMMVEVPSNIFLMDKFLGVGIDGISIGSNDLTQLILGIDRDSQKLADDFDERDEAVLCALEKAVRAAAAKGVTCSICGQAPSFYPELTEKLVEWGITSISVNPDVIETTREIVANAERRLAGTTG